MPTFRNQAALSYNDQKVLSNVVTGELVAPLTISKQAVNETYVPGEKITYVINLVNAGTNDYMDLNFVDTLGAYPYASRMLYPLSYVDNTIRYYQNGVLQPAPTINRTEPLMFGGISVPAGGTAQLIYQANVTKYAPMGGVGRRSNITNRVAVSGTGLNITVGASATIYSSGAPMLSITKALSPETVIDNQPLTYTFTIENYGAGAADQTQNISVADTFNPPMTVTGVYLDGVQLTTDDYQYDTATHVFTTTPGRIRVPAATFRQDAMSGEYTSTPGSATLSVTGNL